MGADLTLSNRIASEQRIAGGQHLASGAFVDEGAAVAYCIDRSCQNSRVLTRRPGDDLCSLCGGSVAVERLRGFVEHDSQRFRELRLHFDFHAPTRRYRWIARVRNDAVPRDGGIYVVYNPFIRTSERALSIAEKILAAIEGVAPGAGLAGIPSAKPCVLSLDEPRRIFAQQLRALTGTWPPRMHGGVAWKG